MNPYHTHGYPYRPRPNPRGHLTYSGIRDNYAFPSNQLPPIRTLYGSGHGQLHGGAVVRRDRLDAGRPLEPDATMSGPYTCPYVRYVTYRRMGWGPRS